MTHERESRRRFLKYAGATAALVGASALGLDYLLNLGKEGSQPSATSITQDKTPPTIQDYKLVPNPDKVQNDKPYELDLSFTAEDSESALDLSAVSLAFEPIYPPEIPRAAYTPEPSPFQTTYTLNPASVSPDGKKATFSQPIAGFVGGKQYRTKISVKDSAGNEAESSVDNPYVREFENLTRKLKVKASAFYYPVYTLYGRDFQGDNTTPLLGYYDSEDPNIINKQIDWGSGFGIGTFLPSFTAPTHPSTSIMKNVYLNSPIVSDMKFAFLYESGGRLKPVTANGLTHLDVNDPSSIAHIKTDFELFATKFFNNPNYLRIDKKPVVYLYLSRIYTGDIPSFLNGLRSHVADLGFELFLVGDEVFWYDNPNSLGVQKRIQQYDAIAPFIMYSLGDYGLLNNFETKVDTKFSEWSQVAKKLNLKFIPSALPGYDARKAPWNTDPNLVPLERSPQRFRKQLDICAKYLDPELETFLIYYNELNENTGIEPSKEEGFTYLDGLRDFLMLL